MKFMNMKRFGSIVMAGALALSLTAPAFAGSATTQPDNSTVVGGAYVAPVISVVIPTTGTAQINPYGLPVAVTKSDAVTQVKLTGQKITSLPLSLRNEGDVALDVNASLAVIPQGDVAIDAAKDTGKTISVSLEVAGLNKHTLALPSYDETLGDLLIDEFADDATWASAETLAAPAAAKNATTVTPAKSTTKMATLGAATVADGVATYGDTSIALFRLTGDVAMEPVTSSGAEDPWKTTDGFEATIVFKFTPAVATYNITEGTHVDGSSDITSVTFKVSGTAVTTAAKDATVTIEVVATTGKTVSAEVNNDGTTINLTESSGTYTGTFTMPAADAEVVLTVA